MPKKKKFDEITLILIVAVAAILLSIFGKASEPAVQEAIKIRETILVNGENFAGSAVIDEKKLMEINTMDYQSLKNSLKIKKDFCILIQDEKGNVILSKGSPSLGRICIA